MKFVGNPTEVPSRTRSGVWRELFEKEFSKNPGKLYEYAEVSSSTAANLRRDYGLDASTVTVKNDDTGESDMHLFVVWYPDKADEIKAGYKPKKKGKSKTANGQTATPASAPTPAPAARK